MSASGSLWSSGQPGSDQRSMQSSSLFPILAKKKLILSEAYKIKASIFQNIPPISNKIKAPETAVMSYHDAFYGLFIYKMPLCGRRWSECSRGGTKQQKSPNQTKPPNFVLFILLVNQIMGV